MFYNTTRSIRFSSATLLYCDSHTQAFNDTVNIQLFIIPHVEIWQVHDSAKCVGVGLTLCNHIFYP